MASLRADSGDALVQPARTTWVRHAPGLALVVGMPGAVPRLFSDYFSYQLGLYLWLGIATQSVTLCWGRAGLIGWIVRELDAIALLIEHDMNTVARLTTHVYVPHQGQLLDEGEFSAIRALACMRAVYAGGVK